MHKLCCFLLLITCFNARPSFAQTDSVQKDALTISVLTCSVGNELYSAFGHTAVRVIDIESGTDMVYNYGTFDFNDPDFYTKFTLGKLLYFLDKEPFDQFIYPYQLEGRSIDEQQLRINPAAEQQLLNFLEVNLQPQNRNYHYDFLYDNCATRVRDIFPITLGNSFQFGKVLEGKRISFRDAIDAHLSEKHWERFGIGIILGAPVDKKMDDNTAMFLPKYLFSGLETATLDGARFTQTKQILPGSAMPAEAPINVPFIVMFCVLVIVVLAYFIKPLKKGRTVVAFIMLLVTGLLGLQLLFMWFVTNHQSCDDNWNVLWALPLNAIAAFVPGKKVSFWRSYSLIAIVLLVAVIIIHIAGIQRFPLFELAPVFTALLIIYVAKMTQSRLER